MDKSGPRYHPLNSPIIKRPDLQSLQQRTLYGAITVAFWAVWIYLWVPLLALLAWLLGFQQAHKYMVTFDGYGALGHVLEVYALVIVMLGGSLIIWATYNILRFRGIEKRIARPGVSQADIGHDLDQEELQVSRWQNDRVLVVRYDDAGQMTTVRGSSQ